MITITDIAAAKIRQVMEENKRTPETAILRVAIQGGGCSGFQYYIGIEEAPKDTDQVLAINGIRTVVDPISASYLQGAEVYFVDGLQGGFKIKNPNAESTCGCGQSFQVKDRKDEK